MAQIITSGRLGILEWFHIGRKDHVERALAQLQQAGITELRTGISWADWLSEGGEEWITWLIERLAKEMNILPCLVYTPPHLGIEPRTSSPPRNIKDYLEFVDTILKRFGRHFEYIELWNEPTNKVEWDPSLDPDWKIFASMISLAAKKVKEYNKKTVLGGMGPVVPSWLDLMFSYNALKDIDVVGIHGFPGTWETDWPGWKERIKSVQAIMQKYDSLMKIWITEAGFSTLGGREEEQLKEFLQVLALNVERIYWYSLNDLSLEYKSTLECITGAHDAHEHNMGLMLADGNSKLLGRILPYIVPLVPILPKISIPVQPLPAQAPLLKNTISSL